MPKLPRNYGPYFGHSPSVLLPDTSPAISAVSLPIPQLCNCSALFESGIWARCNYINLDSSWWITFYSGSKNYQVRSLCLSSIYFLVTLVKPLWNLHRAVILAQEVIAGVVAPMSVPVFLRTRWLTVRSRSIWEVSGPMVTLWFFCWCSCSRCKELWIY